MYFPYIKNKIQESYTPSCIVYFKLAPKYFVVRSKTEAWT